MILEYASKAIWANKIRARQRRLERLICEPEKTLVSLDDFLLASNDIAVKYFEDNKNSLHKLWEYHRLEPHCGSYSTYTYAAFLSLTELYSATELQQDVRWTGGFIAIELGNKIRVGHHAYLEKKENSNWKAFETIPEMRSMQSYYEPWYTFQIAEKEIKITSEKVGGSVALFTYAFPNS